MFSSDSWLSNLDSTLFQGCWFKCKYKIVPNAAKKIWVASQLKQGFWFWFFFFSTCANRTFHADLFPLLAPRGECFWSWVLFVPSPWGGWCQTAVFFLCVGWGGLFNVSILEESLQVGWYNLPPDVPHAEVELCSLLKQIEPGKEKNHCVIFTQEGGNSAVHHHVF